MRVLIVSHGHPDLHPAGGELFAHGLYRVLRSRGENAHFIGFAYPFLLKHQRLGFLTKGDDPHDRIFHIPGFRVFLQSQECLDLLTNEFSDFVETLKPNVIHFNHTFVIGVEALRVVRNIVPQAKIFLTLHEYYAICHHDGQMVRTEDRGLCNKSSPHRCHGCFPVRSPSDFRRREVFIKSHLELVDLFLCPSHFLLQRYREWGLPARKLRYVENGHFLASSTLNHSDETRINSAPKEPPSPIDEEPKSETARSTSGTTEDRVPRNRFAFLGQITPYKGVNVLLCAVELLRKRDIEFHVDIFGAMDLQLESFKVSIMKQIEELDPYVVFHGPYVPDDVVNLMQKSDWIIVPSIWWENSPLIIEEAMIARRPVICSDIGGMSEKVVKHRDGLHFRVSDPRHLADTMVFAMQTDGLWSGLNRGMRSAKSMESCVDEHLEIYNGEEEYS